MNFVWNQKTMDENIFEIGDLAIFVDGEEVFDIPKKGSGYTLSLESNCNNGVTISWDNETWSSKVNYSNYENSGVRTKCNLYFMNIYTESILNGADPVLKDELIPVTIEKDGKVKKADVYKEWYKYESKKWANAVILKNENITYQNEEVIPENNIESYFVWIPKYRYQIWDLGNYNGLTSVDNSKKHTIPLIFGDYNTQDSVNGECTTPMESGVTGKCKVGDYMTHPAFLSIPSTGFWVGKFETSKSNDKEDNSVNSDGVQIKPNEVSWRNIQVAKAFYTAYGYKRDLDSHMMKNTEWGAVAYLQHSSYGSEQSVRINNNSNFLTGYASVSEPTCCGSLNNNQDCSKSGTTKDITLPYYTTTGVLASTTGNISGIYDMSGGVWEYMMGVMFNSNDKVFTGVNASSNSGFQGVYTDGGTFADGVFFPLSKYYDKYSFKSAKTNFTQRILGDATGELGAFSTVEYNGGTAQVNSWYLNNAAFVDNTNPWFHRGGAFYSGTSSGAYSFGYRSGAAQEYYGFRIVLTP